MIREVDMTWRIALASFALVTLAFAQAPAGRPQLEFEVASIRPSPPRTGFHFGDSSGAPDFSNPGMFRCSNCTLVTLIRTAYHLQNYQLPGRSSLNTDTFEVMAKLPEGATPDDVPALLQNLLRDRFALAHHFQEQALRGYQLVVAKSGPKLQPSTNQPPAPAAEQKSWNHNPSASSQGHAHAGLVSFNGSATYRGNQKTLAELALVLADHLGQPVQDRTNLPGTYDILLRWSGNPAPSAGNHAEGSTGPGHGDHGGGPAVSARRTDDAAPALFDALQSQLGLRLVRAEQSEARILIIDHIDRTPTPN